MLAILTVLFIVAISVVVTRVATVALTHTGLSRESARFQARSAFTGVGFTTAETEAVVNHPVRRRIIMGLMLMGNAGIVTVIGSLIISFANIGEGEAGWAVRLALLAGGGGVLWLLANSPLVDRWLSRAIGRALRRWTDLDVRDYGALLHLRGDYRVGELRVEAGDWIAGRTLGEVALRDEGLNVLGVERPDGEYLGSPRGTTRLEAGDVLVVYGRIECVKDVDQRPRGPAGEREHAEAVAAQEELERREEAADRERHEEEAAPGPAADAARETAVK